MPISGQILLDYLWQLDMLERKLFLNDQYESAGQNYIFRKLKEPLDHRLKSTLAALAYIYRYMHIGLQFLRGHDAIIMKNRQIHAARSCNVLNVGDIILAEVIILRCLVRSFAWT
jgi:hypothetical protein